MHSFADVIHLALEVVAYHVRIGLCLAGFAFLLIFLGVVLPAVWSIRPDRRQAATDVLTHVLNALHYRWPMTWELSRHDRHVIGGKCSISGDDREPLAPRLGDE